MGEWTCVFCGGGTRLPKPVRSQLKFRIKMSRNRLSLSFFYPLSFSRLLPCSGYWLAYLIEGRKPRGTIILSFRLGVVKRDVYLPFTGKEFCQDNKHFSRNQGTFKCYRSANGNISDLVCGMVYKPASVQNIAIELQQLQSL